MFSASWTEMEEDILQMQGAEERDTRKEAEEKIEKKS